MLEFEELKLRLVALEPQIEDLKDALGLEQCKAEVRRLEAQQEDPNFWNDLAGSQKVLQRSKQLKNKVERFDKEFQAKCIAERNYEKLEMYVMELLMGVV